ncbi:MAG: hypothetical protein ABI651_08805 [Verrucomicrobiota bacterium]
MANLNVWECSPRSVARASWPAASPSARGQPAGKLRTAFGWSRNQLARVMDASDRALVNWEQGDPISPVYAAKLREIQSIYNELKQLMKPEEIGS